ncbi:translocation/assembly module TamB domain-containing protein [Pseudidiomarina marina]|uniref:translocation/assembly module TamB domain-containing protein n=1 Tax=Pseudidiomarina marina TaxID=502366 RepID=UPI00384D8B9A
MKFVKYLAWTIVALFVLIPSTLAVLVTTSTGSQFIIERSAQLADIDLEFDSLSGNLVGQLTLKNLKVIKSPWQASVESLTLEWQPSQLLDQALVFKKIETRSLLFEIATADNNSTSSEAITLPQLKLPITLMVNDFSAINSNLVLDNNRHQLPDIDGRLDWRGTKLNMKQLHLDYQQISTFIAGSITTRNDYPINLELRWQLSDPIAKSAIEGITGNTHVRGSIANIDAVTTFTVPPQTEQHTIHLQVKDTLSNSRSWLAEVAINQLSTSPLIPIILASDSPWYSWLNSSSLTLDATIDNQHVAIEEFLLSNIGANKGYVAFDGVLNNYLAFNESLSKVSLRGALNSSKLSLPHEAIGLQLDINELTGNVEGSLESFSHNLDINATYDKKFPAEVKFSGNGSASHFTVEHAQINSDAITADITSTVDWSSELAVSASIHSFSAQLEQLKELADYELRAQGNVIYKEQRLAAENLLIRWGENSINLNGAMTESSELNLSLDVPDLSTLSNNEYFSGDVKANLAITGTIDERIDIQVKDLVLNHPDFGNWTNTDQGLISVPVATPLATSVDSLCLTANTQRAPANLCFDTTANNSIQTTQITGQNLPLALLNRFRESDVAERIWGLANLNSSISYDTSTWSLVKTEGALRSERTILFALDEEISTRFNYWQLDWQGNLDKLETSITAELEDDKGLVIGDLVASNIADGADLSGDIIIELRDLTVLQWALPDLRYENAHALAQINISGSTQAPSVTGSIELAAQEVGFAQSGLLLTNVRIAAFDTAEVDNGITLDGQAQSGQGWISIAGLLEPLKPELTLTIQGEEFRAIQIPTATVDISPNLKITLLNERIDVTGEVDIPYVRIDQPEIADMGVTTSTDVEVYQNGEPLRAQEAGLYPIYADVRVTLGDDVKVKGFGFEGDLAGSLRLTETPKRALTASGNISVNKGFYELYGQRLEIERGSFIYNGGPIDNPGLDLRVERSSENMLATEDVRVGAQVSGTLQEPDFRLYSTPAMPDSEVLSYLILGRGSGTATAGNENLQLQALILLGSKGTDFIGESLQDTFGFDEFGIDSTMNPNDTSFYIGKYLSPKLYVKYGVGLFEDTNTFLVRYLLSEKLIIETTASSEAQGGDIFYTIEK